MKKSYVAFVLAMICWWGCTDEKEPTPELAIQQSWTHAFEEQGNSVENELIFRLSDSRDFGPSYFRQQYEFKGNGTCRYLFPFPADGAEWREGTYAFDQQANTLDIYDANGDTYDSFLLRELTLDKMVLVRP